MHSWWITGFCDAESSFTVTVIKSSERKVGWTVKPKFTIGLHIKDLSLLKQIQAFFGVGNIYTYKETAIYVVSSIDSLINVIIPHFTKWPLITQKLADFLLFKQIVFKIHNKEHLTPKGLE